MKWLIAVAAVLILGIAGIILTHVPAKRSSTSAAGRAGSNEVIATISTGEEVDIDSNVPSRGTTIVEFTADF
ncbi:MAG: hypothetical protein KDC98_13080 [Planctomycetes bacterium]|nr:hypothetical protein [Planctomycetota bacterium]